MVRHNTKHFIIIKMGCDINLLATWLLDSSFNPFERTKIHIVSPVTKEIEHSDTANMRIYQFRNFGAVMMRSALISDGNKDRDCPIRFLQHMYIVSKIVNLNSD